MKRLFTVALSIIVTIGVTSAIATAYVYTCTAGMGQVKGEGYSASLSVARQTAIHDCKAKGGKGCIVTSCF